MNDHQRPPRLQPPPRIPAAGENREGEGRSQPNNQGWLRSRFFSLILFGALFAALAAVFLVLPKWQEGKVTHRANEGVERVAPETADLDVAPAEPPSTATPLPPVVIIDTPTPNYRPPTPTRGPSQNERAYAQAMSEGLDALERGQWNDASAAFGRASGLKPNTPEVADGLARAAAGKRRETLAAGIQLAAALEKAEKWREAEKTYLDVLALDPSASLALTGHERAAARADIDEKLEYHARNPARLSSPKVFEEATTLIEEARTVNPRGPRLENQISRLQTVLDVASKPIRVVIESDNLTDVVIYKVGRQGKFTRRELDLKPGVYTVVGSRDGYRDQRLQLRVTPETAPEPVMIACREAL